MTRSSLPYTWLVGTSYPLTALSISWSDAPFAPPRVIADLIASSWHDAVIEAEAHGRDLFPGAMTRLISWTATPDHLRLVLGPTDYRAFVGTNLRHPEIARQYGPEFLANPLGLSIAVVSADDQVIIQRRSDHVFELPGYFHVGGGNVEPDEVDHQGAPGIAETTRRELHEELAITPDQISHLTCLGLAANAAVGKPDLLIAAYVSLTSAELVVRTHSEYSELVANEFDESLADFLVSNAHTTSPVGIACLLALGRSRLGADWFKRCEHAIAEQFAVDST